MATKNYTSFYKLKEFITNEVAPKYLKENEINISQIGLFGYITEVLSILGEDSLNATSIVFKECFANSAENIESLYKMASIYQLDDYFAKAASLEFVIIIDEDDILERGRQNGNYIEFYIDSNTQFLIDDIPFRLEFDIKITSKKVLVNNKTEYIHNAQYVFDKTLSFSTTSSKFIKTKVIKYNNENFVALLVNLRQMSLNVIEETITNNDRINRFTFDFQVGNNSDELEVAGFEAFYQSPVSTANEVQLIKKMENTPKLKSPFCYFSMPKRGVLRVSFPNDLNFFVPEFNALLRMEIYTTKAVNGNFNYYDGENINIITTPNKYEENSGLILFGQCFSGSNGGKNSPTLEEFRDLIITAQSTVLSYSTDNDLKLFFNKMVNNGNTEIMFMKRRDDTLFRLFNAFCLFKNKNNIVIPTNTCDIVVHEENIDCYYPETNRSVIKAGKILKYQLGSVNDLEFIEDLNLTDDLDEFEDTIIYTIPFLTILSSNPVNIGFYLNSINQEFYLDIEDTNNNSIVQFISNNLLIKRDSLEESPSDLGEYEFSLRLLPTTENIDTIVTKINDDTEVDREVDNIFKSSYDDSGIEYKDENRIKVVITILDEGVETCYFELFLADLKNDGSNSIYYEFKNKIKTNDYITTNNRMNLTNSVYNIKTGELEEEWFIPNIDIQMNIYILYRYNEETSTSLNINKNHKFNYVDPNGEYVLVNVYSSKTNRIDLIKPLNMIHGQLSYEDFEKDNTTKYNYKLHSVPVIKANYIKNKNNFEDFFFNLINIYEYLNSGVDMLTNNFDIDIKFYNTYGRSRHYTLEFSQAEIEMYRIQRTSYVDPNLITDKEKDIAKVYVDPNKLFEYEGIDIDGNLALFLDKVHITLNFSVKPYYTTDNINLIRELKDYIINFFKSKMDSQGNNSYYNSNLMKELETTFADKIEYIIFKGINDYPLIVQKLEPIINESNIKLYYEKMMNYVPEYLNIYYRIKEEIMTPQINIDIIQ